jgi:hypothetical protein
MPLPKPKYAKVDETNPEAFCQCDRCGFWRNRSDLVVQIEWAGEQLYQQGLLLVCFDRCFDRPDEQLRTIILPPDPPPIVNARVPNFHYEQYMSMQIQFGAPKIPPWLAGPQLNLCDQTGTQVLVYQYTNE